MSRRQRDFGRIAPFYDAQLLLERAPHAVAARMAGPLAGSRILEVATGTGALAGALVDRWGAPAELVVLDTSVAMLARARRRLGRRLRDTPARPAAVRADARRLPFADATFDLVAIGYLLHLLGTADALAVLAEARRVLRPEGRLLCVTHSPPPTRLGRLYGGVWRLLTDVPAPAGGQRTPGDAAPLLARAGLVVAHERHVGWGYWSQVLLARPRAG
jgi:ubiquinone/menaquinone biosynthesis C-methylase UbiE